MTDITVVQHTMLQWSYLDALMYTQQLFDCRREGTNIPLVVATCIQEVTQRGM